MQNNLNMKTRSAPRRRCQIFGNLKYFNKQTDGRVVNISTTGIALDLNGPFYGASGSKVRIECDDIGILEGTVRWHHNGRVGIQFIPNSNASAQVASYFRFFHRDVKPVLKR